MNEIDPAEARRIAWSARIDQQGAAMREAVRKALGGTTPRAPWEDQNDTEGDA